jgi:ribonuclease Z
VLDGERPPLSVCYMTDTLPTEKMAEFAHKADLLVSEGMYGDDSMREKMGEKGHMLFLTAPVSRGMPAYDACG